MFTIILLGVPSFAVEVPPIFDQTTQYEYLLYQDTCMHNFICKERSFLSCKVPGVRCMGQIVDTIDVPQVADRWTPWVPERLNIDWLPKSLKELSMRMKIVVSDLNTRLLPRGLAIFRVNSCALKGSLDVPNLPLDMVTFDVSSNSLSGVVLLENVPNKLRELRAERNSITCVYGGSALPSSVQRISLTHAHKKIKYVSRGKGPRDKRIVLS